MKWLKEVRDPRKVENCTFPIEYVLMSVMMMHCGQCGSRRQLGRDLAGSRLSSNIWRLIGKAHKKICSCHPDTLNRVMEALDPTQVEDLIAQVFKQLRRCRALDRFRFDGMLNLAIDATGILSFKKRHCETCTHQTSKKSGVTTYFHNVLAAKIVTPIGLVIPVAFEFIENPEGEYKKQDCEIKSWRRLQKKIVKLFPRLKVNLLADGLYAEETTFRQCDKPGWNYIISLSEDKLPSVTKQIPSDKSQWTGSRVFRKEVDGKILTRTVRWMTPLRYHGEIVHVVEMEEHAADGEQLYYNRWITNRKPNSDIAHDLAQNGRLRWKIENEGTNTQKNSGYEMEHAYGLKGNAWKNYYLLLQISQLMNDLVRFSDYIQKATGDPGATFARVFGTIRHYCRCLLESLRLLSPRFEPPPQRFQVRFVT